MKPEISGSLISYMSNMVKQHGGINLAQGLPGFEPPRELLNQLKNLVDEPFHQYAPGNGDRELVNQIVALYPEAGIDESNILVTTGATEALSLIYTYIWQQQKEPFTVLAIDPLYESYRHLPQIFGQKCIPFSGSFENLSEVIRKKHVKAIFVSSPGNPYGKILNRDELEQLIKCAEQEGAALIFDAVYRELYFTEKPPLPLGNMTKQLFFVDSFSKMLSITGWRIGYVITHSETMQKLRSIHDYTGLSSPAPLQRAIARYLAQSSGAQEYLADLRSRIKHSFTLLAEKLTQAGFHIPPIDGGYFIWARMPEPFTDSLETAVKLYETEQVATVPGIHFSEHENSFLRLNIAHPPEKIELAGEKIARFFKNS